MIYVLWRIPPGKEDLLKWMRRITEKTEEEAGRKWMVDEQVGKIIEELGELAVEIYPEELSSSDIIRRIKKKKEKDNRAILENVQKNKDRVLEELWDLIMASFTLAHVMRFSDAEIEHGLADVMDKLERRIGP